jgi:WD40 repeat protein
VSILSKRFVSITVLLLWLAWGCPAYAERPLPQRELKAYVLHENPNSADISPDDSLVVTELSRREPTNEPSTGKVSDLVQLWDFRNDRLVAENILRVKTREKREPLTYWRSEYVRYSADGKIVIAYLDRFLYILRADDLQEIRRIPIAGPPAESRTFKGKHGVHSFAIDSEVTSLELSPARSEVVVVWVIGLSSSWIDVVDFDSAKQIIWNTRDHGLGSMNPKAVSWTSDGEHLVVAVPNVFPCGRPSDAPDVFVVDPTSGALENKLSTGLLVGDIAVRADGRLFAVDHGCVGVFVNHDPKLRVFDLPTGKKIKELSGRGTGVRYAASASRNGNRVAAYTGIVKPEFDWGDMVPFDKHIDATFSVWNLSNYELLFTSQNLTERTSGLFRVAGQVPLRMSPKGGAYCKGEPSTSFPEATVDKSRYHSLSRGFTAIPVNEANSLLENARNRAERAQIKLSRTPVAWGTVTEHLPCLSE